MAVLSGKPCAARAVHHPSSVGRLRQAYINCTVQACVCLASTFQFQHEQYGTRFGLTEETRGAGGA